MKPVSVGVAVTMIAVAVAARFALTSPWHLGVGVPALAVAAWAAFGWAAAVLRRPGVVLRFAGLEWSRDEACTHFLITGATGTGKTARAVVPILKGLRETLPGTGILAIDSKGALWQPVTRIAQALGQEADLRLIRVRPPEMSVEKWTAPLRLNLLADRSVPWTTYAKIIVDTATSAGQKGGQSFFKETARDLITHAMQALDLCGLPVTLENVYHVTCVSTGKDELLEELSRVAAPAAMAERQFFRDFAAQPVEQKGGTVSTAANFLRPYTPPDIAEVFCAVEPNFSLAELDAGRLVCLSVPQTYQVERKYLNLLCKQLFFLHAFRRFDLADADMRKRNMLVLALDEGQKTTLVSEDGFSDYTTVDELREAGVAIITATQTPLSFHAAFGDEKKADVFMANLRTQIHFRAADEKGAKIISEKMGGREVRKYSGGFSGGKESRNWQLTDEPWFKPHALLNLREGQAVVRASGLSGAPRLKSLSCTSLTRPNEYLNEQA
jgi:type IV secretory pathway TraG/TraD family ATPase VirD4